MRENDKESGEKDAQYHETVANYDQGVEWHEEKSNSYNWSSQMDQFVRDLPGTRVLDAGAGTGRDIPLFVERKVQVEALDNSEKSLARLKEKYPDVPTHGADLRTEIPLEDAKYDGIWACASLLNLRKEDVPGTLREFSRLLKNDGKLFVSVKEGAAEEMVGDKAGRRLFSFFTPEEIQGLIEAAGFDVVNIQVVKDAELTGGDPSEGKPSWVCVIAKKTA